MKLFGRVLVAGGVSLAACSSDRVVTSRDTVTTTITCIAIGPRVTPSSARILVGDTLRVSVQPNTCLEPAAKPSDFRFLSSDTLVARVDSLTGLARGLKVGMTSIIARSVKEPASQGAMVLEIVASK